jgi:diguanylate cyclase (GGDEF)-like protein
MLHLDVFSSFAICGSGALVGAAMLRPSLTPDPRDAEALRICRAAYVALGLGLVQPVAQDLPLPLWSQAALALGALSGVLAIGWALAALSGARVRLSTLWPMLGVMLCLVLGAWPAGTRGMTIVCGIGLAAVSSVLCGLGRRLLLRPRDVHERLIGMVMVLMLLSSLLRASYLLTWQGPWESHLLHVPPGLLTPFAVLYGVLPVVFATLLHNVIHARLLARLHQRAMTDHLTGSLSRHALAEGAASLVERTRAASGQLAVLMVDLDRFKQINDRHGHAAGDAVLRQASRLLQALVRTDALVARYGGEEFVALVPVADVALARRVAERLRTGIEGFEWSEVLPGLDALTVSVGVTLLASDEALEAALARADEALYRAKNGGRNQVQMGLAAA